MESISAATSSTAGNYVADTLQKSTSKIIENLVFPNCLLIEGNVSFMVFEDKNEISCINPDPFTYCSVKSNKPIYIHPQYTSVYFEITIKQLDPQGVVVLGLTTLTFPSFRFLPGWETNSFGYHSDDGCLFSERSSKALLELATFGEGDTVGMGIENDVLYFVKNGVRFHSNIQLPQSRFYFTVGMGGHSIWTYNFGTSPFIYTDITPRQFKQSLFDSPNIQHPLLSIPQCLWPFLVNPSRKTTQRHETWVALLSTCHAIRDYLFPLFRYLNPRDLCDLIEGYHIRVNDFDDDFFFHIKTNYQYDLWIKEIGKTSSFEGKWHLERKVMDPFSQVVSVQLSSHPSRRLLELKFERSDLLTAPVKVSNEVFAKRLVKEKEEAIIRRCGAAVRTEGPCCHDAVRDIARNLFARIPKDQCPHMNDITILLSSVVERIAIACMENAMSDEEIKQSVRTAILKIAPELTLII